MRALNTLEISQDILDSARLTVNDLKVEIAISLYSQGRLSVGKARELCGMSLQCHYNVITMSFNFIFSLIIFLESLSKFFA